MRTNKNNSDLHAARTNAADEFYTAYEDVEKEMSLYGFRDTVVYLPCDDYDKSNFYAYFAINFVRLGLSKLISTCYVPGGRGKCRIIELMPDGTVKTDDRLLEGDGDFRSAECCELLNTCTHVVTNPPFSMFREFISWIMKEHKEFIILGNINAVTYKEVFPYIASRSVGLGGSIHSGDREFKVPDNYPLEGTACRLDTSTGKKYIRVKGVRWFTNLEYDDSTIDHSSIRISNPDKLNRLTMSYVSQPDFWKKFDTYDAINVNSVKEIPYDYDGLMGCPITVLDKTDSCGFINFLSPDDKWLRYEIVGMLNSGNKPEAKDFAKPIVDKKCKFKRILIQKMHE